MLAAHRGHLCIARMLLDGGANVALGQDDGSTALHMSAQQGHLAVSKLLVIDARADLNAVNANGASPLLAAAAMGHGEIVVFLLEAGANPNNRTNDGETPLYHAAKHGPLDMVRELVRAKADPLLGPMNPATRTMAGPLDFASQLGHAEVVHELIRMVGIGGCGGATAGSNALLVAAERNHVDVIVVLIHAGVVDTGKALHHACLFGSEAAAKFLVQQRRKVWGANGTKGNYVESILLPYRYTPLVSSFFVGPACSPRIVRLLVDAGADTTSAVRIITEWGGLVAFETPLGLASIALRDKEIAGKPVTEETLHKLEAVRRMLSRVEAIHAVSWLWSAGAPQVGYSGTVARKAPNGTALRTMLPTMRRRARRRGMVWRTLFRWVAEVVVVVTFAIRNRGKPLINSIVSCRTLSSARIQSYGGLLVLSGSFFCIILQYVSTDVFMFWYSGGSWPVKRREMVGFTDRRLSVSHVRVLLSPLPRLHGIL